MPKPRKITHTIEVKDARYWHLFYLYRDDDFQHIAQKLFTRFKEKYGPNITVSNDMGDFQLDDADKQLVRDIEQIYAIKNSELVDYLEGTYHQTGMINPRTVLLEIEDRYLKLPIFPDTRLEHIKEVWGWIEQAQKQLPQYSEVTKPPKYHELIYAIHRIKREENHITYSQIARMLNDRTLKSVNFTDEIYKRFDTAEDIRKYYSQFDPSSQV